MCVQRVYSTAYSAAIKVIGRAVFSHQTTRAHTHSISNFVNEVLLLLVLLSILLLLNVYLAKINFHLNVMDYGPHVECIECRLFANFVVLDLILDI